MRGTISTARVAVMLLAAAVMGPVAAQSQSGHGDRCAALRERFAKHPSPNPAVEARRQQRLADCEAGKDSGSDQGDETTSGGQPQPGTPAGGGDGQPQPGTLAGSGSGQPDSGASGTSTPAPVGMTASGLAPVGGTVRSAPGGIGRIALPTNIPKLSVLFSTLDVSVTTGDDDLRANSGAWIDVKTPDGFSKKCFLKQSPPAWDEHSTREVQCQLPEGMTADQLKSAQLILEYDGSPNAYADVASTVDPFQTFDNWKVNAVHITAMAPGQTPQCLVNVNGNPQLAELKGDNRTFQLSQGGC